jgi:hypothetical protein
MFSAADPDLLPVDDIVIAVSLGECPNAGGISAARRLGDAECL